MDVGLWLGFIEVVADLVARIDADEVVVTETVTEGVDDFDVVWFILGKADEVVDLEEKGEDVDDFV